AADARVALIVQRIVRNVVLRNQPPDLLFRPVGQRADLYQAELFVPADDRHLGPVGALIAADGAGPGVHAEHGLVKHLHFAVGTALVGVGAIERAVVDLFVLLDRVGGPLQFDRDAVAAFDFLTKIEGLLKLIARVEVEDRRGRGDLGQHVNQDHPLRTKGRRHGEPRREALGRPAEDVWRLGQFQGGAGFVELGLELGSQDQSAIVGQRRTCWGRGFVRRRNDDAKHRQVAAGGRAKANCGDGSHGAFGAWRAKRSPAVEYYNVAKESQLSTDTTPFHRRKADEIYSL